MSANDQAVSILETLQGRDDVDLPDSVDAEDIAEAIDPTKPEPVNLKRVLEQFVEDER